MSDDLNLVSVSTCITRGGNIHSGDTAQKHSIDDFSVRELIVIPSRLKIFIRFISDIARKSDFEGGLIQNDRISVDSLLPQGRYCDLPPIYDKIPRNITQVVVIGIESIRAALSRDLNLVSVGVSIARGGDIHSCGTNECDRVDDFSVRKQTISIKIRHSEGGLIQNHGVSVIPLLR